MASPAPKRPKITQKFRTEYSKLYPFIQSSKLGDEFARCTVCECDVKIACGGRSDLERHIKTPKHVNRDKAASTTPSLVSMFKKQTTVNSLEEKVLTAEILFSNFLLEHNLPFAVADHAGDLFRKMFPDSEIAKRFSCARTKVRRVVKNIAEDAKLDMVAKLREQPFSLATDGSNDKGEEQIYPVVVRYHNDVKVVTDVLNIVTPEGPSTGENIFNALDKELSSHGLSWDKCVSISSDNAAVMLGKHNGVVAHVQKKNPNIHVQGCPCHLLHIAAKRGAEVLHSPVESVLIELFHYLENSSKRVKSLHQFQQDTGTAVRKIIKHGPTRWLSLHQCVERLVEQWEAISAFVNSEMEGKPTDRLKRLHKFFTTPTSKAYVLFLSYALPKFIQANLMLQREEPTIHRIRSRLHEVVTDLLIAFIKPEAITKCADIYKIEHHRRSRQKDRGDIMIGQATREYMTTAGDALSSSDLTTFYTDVRGFYSTSLKYVFDNLPLQEEALEHAEVLDPNLRSKVKFSSLRYWAERFSTLAPPLGLDSLEQEFMKFQIDPLQGIDTSQRVDTFWQIVGDTVKDDMGMPKFKVLSTFMKGLCVLPHSNADAERVFSLVRKNKTEVRARMSRDLLSDILLIKMKMVSRGEYCFNSAPSRRLLAKANKT